LDFLSVIHFCSRCGDAHLRSTCSSTGAPERSFCGFCGTPRQLAWACTRKAKARRLFAILEMVNTNYDKNTDFKLSGLDLSNLVAQDVGIDKFNFHMVSRTREIGQLKETLNARAFGGILQKPITEFMTTRRPHVEKVRSRGPSRS